MSRLEEFRAKLAAHREEINRYARASMYVPHKLHAKQVEFCMLGELEALFGGAAGGGKTDALLAGGLQYVHRPRYSALILRRTLQSLSLPGSLLDRAHQWLSPTDARWDANLTRYEFPSGARLQFGYCDSPRDLDRYKSAEFHYIAIDEVTEWPIDWYSFFFSRLRRGVDDDIPLRFRGATNPDGIGAPWVRKRFGIPIGEIIPGPIRAGDRVFLPARAEDNPSLDLEAYEKSLAAMAGGRSSTKYKQLRWGQWLVDTGGLVYHGYDERRNVVDLAPTPQERAKWTFLLGVDYGFSNDCAFVVVGFRDHDPTVYVFEAFKEPHLTPSDAAECVAALDLTYKFVRIIGDMGGLGKGYAEEARRRFRLPIEPAEKRNKRGYIDLFNGDLEGGRIQLVRGKCTQLVEEWEALMWDEQRLKEAAGLPNHCSDAALYIWRAATAYHNKPEEKPPEKGTKAWLDAEEKRLEAEVDAELDEELRPNGKARWWRGVGF